MRTRGLMLSVLVVGCGPAPVQPLDHDSTDIPPGVFDDDDAVPLGSDLSILGTAVGIIEENRIHGHVAHLAPWLQREGVELALIGLRNDGSAAAEVDVTLRIPDFARPTTRRFEVPADGADHTFQLTPEFDLRGIYDLQSTINTTMTMVVASEDDEISEQLPIEIIPRTRVPWFVAEGGEDGAPLDVRMFVLSLVQPDSPPVAELLSDARGFAPNRTLRGYQGTSSEVYAEVGAIWAAMQAAGIGYSNVTGNFFDGAQRVRLHEEVWALSDANCVDGSIFFAAALSSLGLAPRIVFMSGHMLVAVPLEDPELVPEGTFIAIETTAIGHDFTFDQGVDAGADQYNTAEQSGDPLFLSLDVNAGHRVGLSPMPF